MTRLNAVILAVLTIVLSAVSVPAQAMVVKTSATVEGPYVHLADVLADPGETGDYIVAAAPAPGERDTLSYRKIAAAARKAGLNGLELGRGYIEIRRAGRISPRISISAERPSRAPPNAISASATEQSAWCE